MITADTITDEQIRELRYERLATDRDADVTDCDVALRLYTHHWTGKAVTDADAIAARARCAQILNARGSK